MYKKQKKMQAVKELLAGIEQHISDILDFNDPDDFSQIPAIDLVKESISEYEEAENEN